MSCLWKKITESLSQSTWLVNNSQTTQLRDSSSRMGNLCQKHPRILNVKQVLTAALHQTVNPEKLLRLAKLLKKWQCLLNHNTSRLKRSLTNSRILNWMMLSSLRARLGPIDFWISNLSHALILMVNNSLRSFLSGPSQLLANAGTRDN
jgi:hypothetical protein